MTVLRVLLKSENKAVLKLQWTSWYGLIIIGGSHSPRWNRGLGLFLPTRCLKEVSGHRVLIVRMDYLPILPLRIQDSLGSGAVETRRQECTMQHSSRSANLKEPVIQAHRSGKYKDLVLHADFVLLQ